MPEPQPGVIAEELAVTRLADQSPCIPRGLPDPEVETLARKLEAAGHSGWPSPQSPFAPGRWTLSYDTTILLSKTTLAALTGGALPDISVRVATVDQRFFAGDRFECRIKGAFDTGLVFTLMLHGTYALVVRELAIALTHALVRLRASASEARWRSALGDATEEQLDVELAHGCRLTLTYEGVHARVARDAAGSLSVFRRHPPSNGSSLP